MNLNEFVDNETNSREVDQEELLGVTTAKQQVNRGRRKGIVGALVPGAASSTTNSYENKYMQLTFITCSLCDDETLLVMYTQKNTKKNQ